MADNEAAVADAPATGEGLAPQEGVGDAGNLSGENLAGILLKELETVPEETEVSEEGEGTTEEQATDDEPETDTDSAEETHADEDEGDDPEDLSEDDLRQLKPKAAEKARKRIDKLTARAKEAEERAQALENRLARLEQGQQESDQPTGNSFAERVQQANAPDQLQKLYETARDTKKWARKVLAEDQFDYDGNIEVEGQKYSKAQIANALNEAEDAIETALPQRFQYLRSRMEADQNAVREFPAWQDQSHPDHKMLVQAYTQSPIASYLQQMPNGRYVAGLVVEGIKAKQAAQKPAESPATPPKAESKPREQKIAPKVPGGDDGYSPAPKSDSQDIQKRMTQKDSLSNDDLVAILAAQETAKRKQKG